jgi:UDP-GlcNAc:undecaprenyl-phosphate/decaprenyl-phosphate GlcNAc-1-phosphate transferase
MPGAPLTFAIALITSLGVTVPVRRLAIRVGMVDQPGPRKIHLEPVPLLGGIAIYTAVFVAFFLSFRGQSFRQILGILAASTFLLLVGTLDDRGLLHHQLKLFAAMPLAGLILLASGIRAQFFTMILHARFAAVADSALTVLWITGITAAFSILDYMDGVCAGIAAIASLFLAILAILNNQVLPTTLAAAILGAALGFLRWNFTPAKIFMGDGGAMLLGFLLATLALTVHVNAVSPNAACLAPVLVLAVPILDTALVSFSRLRRGLVPFTSPGKDHAGHRLANSGLGTRSSVLVMYAMGFTCGLLAILCTRLNSGWLSILVMTILLAFAVAVALLESMPFERQQS